jgi:hypothetical protein
MRWTLNVILICISFMARDVKHFIIYLLDISVLLLRIVYSVHLPIYLVGCWFFAGSGFWAPCIF